MSNNEYSEKNWRRDPDVAEALKDRPASEVALIDCPHCGAQNYYNEGSHASCRLCERDLSHLLDDDFDFHTVEDQINYELWAEENL